MFEKDVVFVLVYDPKVSRTAEHGSKQFIIMDLKDLTYYQTYLLVVLDYFALYIPKMWTHRFHYLKQISNASANGWKDTHRVHSLENGILCIDLTEDMYHCFYKTEDHVDYSSFPDCIFYMFQGFTSYISLKQRHIFKFMLPFIEFLGPTPTEVEYWRKKSQLNSQYFLLSDI